MSWSAASRGKKKPLICRRRLRFCIANLFLYFFVFFFCLVPSLSIIFRRKTMPSSAAASKRENEDKEPLVKEKEKDSRPGHFSMVRWARVYPAKREGDRQQLLTGTILATFTLPTLLRSWTVCAASCPCLGRCGTYFQTTLTICTLPWASCRLDCSLTSLTDEWHAGERMHRCLDKNLTVSQTWYGWWRGMKRLGGRIHV